MVVVKIITGEKRGGNNYFLKQTPNCSGLWKGVQFTLDPIQKVDYVIIVNYVPEITKFECSCENIWGISLEPPVPNYRWFYRSLAKAQRIYTTDIGRKGNKYIHSQVALPWLVDKNYDFLRSCSPPEKSKLLSWITSNKLIFKGHQTRLQFLENVTQAIDFDLFGSGFKRIPDKWDGLAPYQYSLAIENYSGLYYWTEKIADCFLSYTMPIYYGCTNLTDYFPKESFIRIDINQPQEAIEIIKETISSDRWKKHLDAIIYARELVLEHYQFFPFITQAIQEDQGQKSTPQEFTLSPVFHFDINYRLQTILKKLKR